MMEPIEMSPAKKVRSWKRWTELALRAGLAAVFILAGAQKLTGAEAMVAIFAEIGLGQWFRVATGLIELLGAAFLLMPGASLLGIALLGCTMVGAFGAHLFLIGESTVPALVLLLAMLAMLGLQIVQRRERINDRSTNKASVPDPAE